MRTPALGIALFLMACGSVSNDPDAGSNPDASRTPDAPPGETANLTAVATGPGTIMIAPSGASCGAGCVTLPVGTSVTLTPSALLGGDVDSWTGPCAGTGAGMPCTFTLTADTSVQSNFVCTGDVIVLAGAGSDTASGACGAPVKTVTHALTLATTGQTIRLLPGTYDTANGEVFPLSPGAVNLVGDETDKGMTTMVVGPTTVSNVIHPTGGAITIAGLTVSGGNIAVNVDVASVALTLRNNRLTASNVGLWFGAAGNHTVSDNMMYANTGHGIAHITGSPNVKYERNEIYGNSLGVETNSPGGDFGGGALGSTGGNRFYCNTRNDLWIYQTPTLFARNNFFDHVPPTTGADGGGIDAYQGMMAGGPIDTAGAQLTSAPCP